MFVLVFVIVDPLIGCSEGVNYTHLVGYVCIELNAEAVNIVESEPDKIIKIFFFIVAEKYVLVGVVEAEHVFNLKLFENLAQVDTVRQSDSCNVDL